MYSKKVINRVKLIKDKILYIQNIIKEKGSVEAALEDSQTTQPAILMHLVSIAEQFDKLMHSGELEILSNFEKEDIKGSYELRNFIAHDYEGVDLVIVEAVIKQRLPIILQSTNKVLSLYID